MRIAAHFARLGTCCCWAAIASSSELPSFEPQQLASDLGVGYAVSLVDLTDDDRLDIVVVDQRRVVWFENPGQEGAPWPEHTLILDQTQADNVAIAPYDVDGDGRLDFALAAEWRPRDTQAGGTIQWLQQPAAVRNRWSVIPIGDEPTAHRLRWADLDGDGRAELIVVPLMGRGTAPPDWNQHPVRILAYSVPGDPARDPWPQQVLNEELHVCHNFWPGDFDGDGRTDILIASFDGVHLLAPNDHGQWHLTQLGTGNQQSSPNRGASEIKPGRLANGSRYIATIEPWHGNQVVVYTEPHAPDQHWSRHVIDEQLQWGHAVWCVDLDGDADHEIVIGVRDQRDEAAPCGVRIYDPVNPAAGKWQRTLVDPGGVAVEDLAVADLDGDGQPEIVAVGRQTHNLRVYWNRAAKGSTE